MRGNVCCGIRLGHSILCGPAKQRRSILLVQADEHTTGIPLRPQRRAASARDRSAHSAQSRCRCGRRSRGHAGGRRAEGGRERPQCAPPAGRVRARRISWRRERLLARERATAARERAQSERPAPHRPRQSGRTARRPRARSPRAQREDRRVQTREQEYSVHTRAEEQLGK